MMRRAVQRLIAADRFEFAGFDDAEQTGLLLQCQGVNFIEQNRAVAGRLELADLGAIGAGEGSLGVAKEGAFDQIGRLAPHGTVKNGSPRRGEQS